VPKLVTKHADVRTFADEALPFLVHDEAEHSIQLAITKNMLGRTSTHAPFLATLRSDEGQVVGVATLHPGQHLIVSGGSIDAINELCRVLDEDRNPLSGVFGPSQVAQQFAQAWCTPRSLRARTLTRMGLLVVRKRPTPRSPPGNALCATPQHLALSIDWIHQFYRELQLSSPPPSADAIQRQIASGNVFFWALPSGEPASTAVIDRESPEGMAITSVYTPPTFRGQGFASACVAHACQVAFDRGKHFCTLYADLDNPTSTGLYARLGFHQLSTADDIAFEQ
jgi:predicted GNAT family acetyltransferase